MLRWTRAEAAEKLKKQILKGEQLLSREIVDLDRFRQDTRTWLDFNAELLRTLFTSDEIRKEYLRVEQAYTEFDVFADQYERERDELVWEIRDKLPRLHSISQRLELIPEEFAFSQSSPAIQPSIDIDPVMKIPSRKQMDEDLAKAYSDASKREKPFSLLMIDYDDLKKLNEAVGHPNADQVLHSVASKVSEIVSGKGAVYRYAGDELLAFLPNFNLEEAAAVGERIRREIESLSHKPMSVQSTVTIGVASFPESASKPEEVLTLADQMLMKAKELGKNSVLSPAAIIGQSGTDSAAQSTASIAVLAPQESTAKYAEEVDRAKQFFKQELGKGIETIAHWEVIANPTRYSSGRISDYATIEGLLRECSTHLRSSSFPYTDPDNASNFSEGRQSFKQWDEERGGFRECYRLHKSGLFIYKREFWEDLYDRRMKSEGSHLAFVSAIHTLTEFALFFASLFEKIAPREKLEVKIRLVGCKGRELAPYTDGVTLWGRYACRVEEICITQVWATKTLKADTLQIARDWAKHVFHLFNWNDVADQMIDKWQKKS
jgi:diguanylate cyclase (GGDEF)-like protein